MTQAVDIETRFVLVFNIIGTVFIQYTSYDRAAFLFFLHLLNASKLAKKVILDSRPINKYMATQRLQQGVWVIRPVL